DLGQVLHRVFPLQRGLYEDKVANVWCALSVIVKLKNLFDVKHLASLSMYPLLKKDELVLPFIAATVLFNVIATPTAPIATGFKVLRLNKHPVQLFSLVASGLITAEYFIRPPERYPDIYVVLNVLLSCGMLSLLLIHFNLRQFGIWKTAIAGVASENHEKGKKAK
ncbi:hypothetical protein HDU67_000362, partial [Dinochytrium kinnereticum]